MKIFKRILKYSLYLSLFIGVCIIAAHCTFKHHAASSYAAAKKQIPFDVVIVPGFPYQDTAINVIYKARVLWAKHLYDSGYTKNIIFSGAAVHTPYIESRTMKSFAIRLGIPESNVFTEEKAEHKRRTMKSFAIRLGIPESNVFTEEKAEHSSENIYFGWKRAIELDFKKIALATDPYQSGMLQSVIDKYTPGVMSIPIQFEKIDPSHTPFSPVDVTDAKVNPFTPLSKREGFWERFRGTMGKRIKEEAVKKKK